MTEERFEDIVMAAGYVLMFVVMGVALVVNLAMAGVFVFDLVTGRSI